MEVTTVRMRMQPGGRPSSEGTGTVPRLATMMALPSSSGCMKPVIISAGGLPTTDPGISRCATAGGGGGGGHGGSTKEDAA
jgi:hypothetical protein